MPRISQIEICGFRSFGEPQELKFEGPCAVISGPNSQGKTAVAEAIEFLFTGQTVRRELLGGAKAEFDRSLRNVHRDADCPVWVSAEIEDSDGNVRIARRELLSDFTAQDDCTSRLRLDGDEVLDLEALGFPLADRPLSAPVLLQHSLRFALSAKPSERTEYFKSVVEIADLELFRDAVAASRAGLAGPESQPIDRINACAQVSELAVMCADLLALDHPTPENVDDRLRDGLEVALTTAGVAGDAIPSALGDRVGALSSVVDARREERFPLAALRVGALPEGSTVSPYNENGVIAAYVDARAETDREVEHLHAIFEAVLAIPALGELHEPIDCPVCQTDAALTPERVAELRTQLEGGADFKATREAALANLQQTIGWIQQQALTAGNGVPQGCSWSDDEWTKRSVDLGGFGITQATRAELREKALAARSSLSTYEERRLGVTEVLRGTDLNAADKDFNSDLQAKAAALGGLRDTAIGAARAFADAAAPVATTVAREIDRSEGLARWSELIALAKDPKVVAEALADRAAVRQVQRDLDAAVGAIDRAKGRVFDTRFDAISENIEHWWELLRPDEHVSFGGVRRRGSGRRFVDFKANMREQLGGTHVERDAIGVLSDSQLNALGLASFLARAEKQATPFLVLDEPVQAGDDEHRTTFARFAVERLIQNGVQVVVTSFDDRLTRLLTDLYREAPIDTFAVELSDRKAGSEITKTSNPVVNALHGAKPFARHDSEEIRNEGTRKLRPAAERLAKEIILKGRRAQGDDCDIGEYDGKTLGPLLPILNPYLVDDSERGKWRAIKTILDPGHHDDVVPARSALMTALGDLERSVKDHDLQ